MRPIRRAHDYGRVRHVAEQLLLRLFARRWLARLHYRAGLHRPIRIWREQLRLAHTPPAPPPLRIGFASDFHAGMMTHPEVVRAACAALAALAPDVVILGGDYVSWDQRFIDDLMPDLAAISAPLGRFAVIGNHDVWAEDVPIRRALSAHGYQVLLNTEVTLPPPYQQVALYGLDDPTSGAPLAPPPLGDSTQRRVLVMHSPEGLALVAPDRYHLAFAGHTHGGQVALPGGYPLALRPGSLSRRYAAGRHRVGQTDREILVSRGVGYGDFPVRWHAPADVLLATVIWHESGDEA